MKRNVTKSRARKGKRGKPDRRVMPSSSLSSQERSSLLDEVLAKIPVILYVLDEQGMTLLSEGRGLAPLGLKAGEAVGRSAFEFYPEHPTSSNYIRRALAGQETRAVIEVAGRAFDSWFSPLTDADLRPRGMIGVAMDVTEQMQTQKELRQAYEGMEQRVAQRTADMTQIIEQLQHEISHRRVIEEQMRREKEFTSHIVTAAPALIAGIDAQGILQSVNPAFCRVTGYVPEEIVNQEYWTRFYPGAEYAQVEKLFRDFEKGPVVNYEMALTTKTGEKRVISWNSINWFDAQGKLLEIIGLGIDVTEKRQSEEQARQRLTELAHISRLATLGELTSGLAHEINQPLAAVANYAAGCVRRIQAGTTDAAQLLPAIQQIHAEAQRAGEIIRHLKDFIRKQEPRRASVDLNAVVHETAGFIVYDADRLGVQLTFDLHEPLPQVQADKVQIEQVLLNLFKNALEAMADPSIDRRAMTVRTRVHGDGLRCEVSDTGAGLSQELLTTVFEPFTTTKPDGLGLGLSISRSLVEAHRGTIWAEINPERGATFAFTLPLAEDGSG